MAEKANPKAKKQSSQSKKGAQKTWPFYVAIILLFVIYLMVQKYAIASIVVGAMLFLLIIVLIVLEFMNGIREEGIAKNVIEVVLAVAIVLILWFGAALVLHTSAPLNVVPSCSMLPYLHRGDMIAISGVTDISQLKAPIVSMSAQQFNSMYSNIGEEFLSCVAYNESGDTAHVSQYFKPGWSIGLYSSALNTIINSSSQPGAVKYTCGIRNVTFQNGTVMQEAYTTAITIGSTTIIGDMNNSVVVYKTIPGDSFYDEGDAYVVHRVYAIINVSGSYYILTKGDNNPGLDMQYGNYPISIRDVEGRVIASVPYIGYLKLILSNSFSQPAGCNFVTQH
ncbi:MAG: hypothetical protein QXW10_00530 [Candidatus Micrarchaeaceae archaeon]